MRVAIVSGGGAHEALPQRRRYRKPSSAAASPRRAAPAGSQRRRSFQSDSSDDWEYETRGEVYRDRFYAILRFLWDTQADHDLAFRCGSRPT